MVHARDLGNSLDFSCHFLAAYSGPGCWTHFDTMTSVSPTFSGISISALFDCCFLFSFCLSQFHLCHQQIHPYTLHTSSPRQKERKGKLQRQEPTQIHQAIIWIFHWMAPLKKHLILENSVKKGFPCTSVPICDCCWSQQ